MYPSDEKPFIDILTGLSQGSQPVIWAYHLGATEHLVKQMEYDQLIRKIKMRVRYFIGDWGGGDDCIYDDYVFEITFKGLWAYWTIQNKWRSFPEQ